VAKNKPIFIERKSRDSLFKAITLVKCELLTDVLLPGDWVVRDWVVRD
jgi:hypothetical protein